MSKIAAYPNFTDVQLHFGWQQNARPKSVSCRTASGLRLLVDSDATNSISITGPKDLSRQPSFGSFAQSTSSCHPFYCIVRPMVKRKRKRDDSPPPEAEAERVHGLARQENFYGLIQELVTPNVFRLLVSTCLLNQTKGRAAMPVFWELLRRWPDEQHLAKADLAELTELLQPIGLHNIRARRLINMAQVMIEIPYDENNSFKSRDRSAPDTPIGIYPGVGRYAIDSWRIFVAGGGANVGLQGAKPVSPFDTNVAKAEAVLPIKSSAKQPQWKSVVPLDKELRAYLVWRWAKEGQVWDPLRGLASTSSELP